MAKRTKAKKKAPETPRSPPPAPPPEDLADIPLEVVFAEELNGDQQKEQPHSDSSKS